MARPYSLTSARFLARGRSDDRSTRTAGMRAKSDPLLQPMKTPAFPRFVRWIEKKMRRHG